MVLALLTVTSAQAQVITTSKVDITLLGMNCADAPPGELHLVVNGNDRLPVSIPQDPSNRCHYTGEIPDAPIEIRKTIFSVRFGGARSDCRVAGAKPDKDAPLLSVGKLTFSYEPQSARSLSATLKPKSFHLTYVRELGGKPGVSVACRENGDFAGSNTIHDVAWGSEALSLQFRSKPEERDAIWMKVDDPVWTMIQNGAPLTPSVIGEAYQRQVFADLGENRLIRVDEQSLVAKRLQKKGFKQAVLKPQ